MRFNLDVISTKESADRVMAVPVIGAVPALLRAVAGAIQMVVNIIFAALLLLPSLCDKHIRGALKEVGQDFFGGLKMVVYDSLRAIPFVGFTMFSLRPCIQEQEANVDKNLPFIITGQFGKIMRTAFGIRS